MVEGPAGAASDLVAALESQGFSVSRGEGELVAARAQRSFVFGDLEVDLDARDARVAGRPVSLGPLEFGLLEYLTLNAGVAVSREQVLRDVYGYSAAIDTERVDLLVRRLRAKLGSRPVGRIVAVPGYGYRLERRAIS